jgi:hypothetical protein
MFWTAAWIYLLELMFQANAPFDSLFALNVAPDRNYTAMRTHVRRSVHLSALLITGVT